MRKPFLSLSFILTVTACWAAGAEWKNFDAGRFSILMPQPPRPTANSQWVAMDPQGRAYNASSGYLPNPPRKAKDYFDQTVEIAVEGTHGHLLYKKYLSVQDHPACEFKLTDGKHVVGGRLILDKTWVYILEFATDNKTFDSSLMKKFFDSFHITEPGK